MKADQKLWITGFVIQQTVFAIYHDNSYAANSAMLRSPKPLLMRDLFLTQARSPYPNPLGGLYVPSFRDAVIGCSAAACYGYTILPIVGWGTLTLTYFFGGVLASFAFLFQSQISTARLSSAKFDCNAASLGAWCAVAVLPFYCSAPVAAGATDVSRKVAAASTLTYNRAIRHMQCARTFSSVLLSYSLYDEYVRPRLFGHGGSLSTHSLLGMTGATEVVAVTGAELRDDEDDAIGHHRSHSHGGVDGIAVVHNWGCLGGIFAGLICGSLLLRRRRDAAALKSVFDTIDRAAKKSGGS